MKLLKLKDVMAMTSLSKASVYRQMNDGKFPHQLRSAQDLLLGLALK